MAQLQSTGSIVDFLNSQGRDSSFSARRKLFNDFNLGETLGEFEGSAEQNTTLLRNLQSSITREGDFFIPDREGNQTFIDAPQVSTPSAPSTIPTAEDTTPSFPSLEDAGKVKKSSIVDDITAGLPEEFTMTEIPDVQPPTPDEILARARGEVGVQLAEREAQIKKERIQAALPGELEGVKNEFASRGLVFSGARTLKEQEVRDEALAEMLDIDLQFAKILGNAIDKAASEIGKELEEIVNDAKDQRKEEVAFLKSVGLAVDPLTGEVFPTMEAQKFMVQQQVQDFNNQLALARLNNDSERIEIAKQNLNISLARELRIAGDDIDNPGNYTDQEIRKLRANDVDPIDIDAADEFLYGSGARRVALNANQLTQIGEAYFKAVKEGSKEVEGIDKGDFDALIAFLETTNALDINGDLVKLTPAQRDLLVATVESSELNDRNFGDPFPGGIPYLPGI